MALQVICPPEQFRREKFDGRTDMYSLAIMAYEILTGELPFKAKDLAEMSAKHLKNQVPAIDPVLGIPNWVDRLIKKSTYKNREKRFSDMSEWCEFFVQNLYKPGDDRIIQPSVL